MTDQAFMRQALSLARRNLGQTWPNPAVGAVIVGHGAVVGVGTTARGGRPHAETQAITQAQDKAIGATLYVTLEPCAHQGKTPPCTDAIIASGIGRVVIAAPDPHEIVNGKGIAKLKQAGIEVIENVCRAEAEALNVGFFSVIRHKRPYVSVKIASSLDGSIATRSGESRWLTGEQSRAFVHHLRAEHDALLTGIGTVLADDPKMTCRLPGMIDRSPVRIVADSRFSMPEESKLLATIGAAPLWLLTSEKALAAHPAKAEAFKQKGVQIFTVPLKQERIDITAALRLLADQGITRVMVEAGMNLTTAITESGHADRIYWFHAGAVLGQDARPAIATLHYPALAQAPRLRCVESRQIGADIMEVWEPCSPVS